MLVVATGIDIIFLFLFFSLSRRIISDGFAKDFTAPFWPLESNRAMEPNPPQYDSFFSNQGIDRLVRLPIHVLEVLTGRDDDDARRATAQRRVCGAVRKYVANNATFSLVLLVLSKASLLSKGVHSATAVSGVSTSYCVFRLGHSSLFHEGIEQNVVAVVITFSQPALTACSKPSICMIRKYKALSTARRRRAPRNAIHPEDTQC